jgi:glycerol-3-phosphate acyltransferase PlsX
MIIAVDAAGGEYGPREIVKGAIKAAQEYDVEIILVGRKDILSVLGGRQLTRLGMSIVNATQIITSKETPIEAVHGKPDSSIVVGTNLVRDGSAAAFISAGNTGAVYYSSLVNLGRMEGVERPAIGSILNIIATAPVLLIDSGANADCRPNHLVQFAQLGTIYARDIFGMEAPRIGLLNNGEEETRGNRLAKESYNLLKETRLNFIGNVEGQDISRETADVIVTDGFTGNIVLKAIEGLGDSVLRIRQMGQFISKAYHLQGRALARDVSLGSFIGRMDYRQYGGACLLGVNGNIIIAHGRSHATAIKNAIGLAKRTVEQDICQKIREGNHG